MDMTEYDGTSFVDVLHIAMEQGYIVLLLRTNVLL